MAVKKNVKKVAAKKTPIKKEIVKVETPKVRKNATSLVMGILSLMFWWIPVIGLVFPIIGISTRKWDESGMGTAGLVTSIIGLVCTAFLHLFWALAIIAAIAGK